MTFIATASGDSYIQQAQNLLASFRMHDWPRLLVVTERDAPSMDDIWGGRGLKTRFAHFIPDGTPGPVAFLDCDCQAVGPYVPPPNIDEGTLISKIRSCRHSPTHGPKFLLQSCFLAFSSLTEARAVCNKWYKEINSYPASVGSDEPALHRAIQGMNVVDIQDNGNPMPNLTHK